MRKQTQPISKAELSRRLQQLAQDRARNEREIQTRISYQLTRLLLQDISDTIPNKSATTMAFGKSASFLPN